MVGRGQIKSRMKEISSSEEYERILGGAQDSLLIIEYGLTTCSNCNMMQSVVEKFQIDFDKKFKLYGLDLKQFPELKESLGIVATPTYVFYKHGKEIVKFIGADPAGLRKLIVANL